MNNNLLKMSVVLGTALLIVTSCGTTNNNTNTSITSNNDATSVTENVVTTTQEPTTNVVTTVMEVTNAPTEGVTTEATLINGFTQAEYNSLSSKLSVNWMNNNNYIFGKVDSIPSGVKEAYDVVDLVGNRVGVIYLMETSSASIEINAHGTTYVKGSVYVVFE